MALPELRGTGRLLTDPRHGTGKNDKPWTNALIKFSTWRKVDGQWEEGDGTIAACIAFDDNATLLAGYAKGDTIGVHGTVKAAMWNDKPQLAVTVTSCWTPEKQAKPATDKPAKPASSRTGAILAEARAANRATRERINARNAA